LLAERLQVAGKIAANTQNLFRCRSWGGAVHQDIVLSRYLKGCVLE
jgi:hypothetical protein